MGIITLPAARRLTTDEYFTQMARLVSSRGTCARRRVGCVLVSGRRHVLATGYNGVPSGAVHCIDVPCPGHGLPSGQGLDLCEAVHAEQNALLQCPDVWDIGSCYTTASPCITCVKLLLNTSCQRIVFLEEYPHSTAKELWLASGVREWKQLENWADLGG